jgi:undecaprenyl-diphosphatase
MDLSHLLKIVVLAVVQGLAELLPVSSSAHVIVAEKLMGLDASASDMTLLLVLLHTGTMLAVIVYFWKAWKQSLFASRAVFLRQVMMLGIATVLTGVVGWPIKKAIEHVTKGDIEELFSNLVVMAVALAVVGILIIIAGLFHRRQAGMREIGAREAVWIGAVQGLCLPFRGFSRSGATISTGLLLGTIKARAEEFSFALAVILTPAVVGKEAIRFMKDARHTGGSGVSVASFAPALIGMVCAFLAGLVALRWLSGWLEHGRWYLFGLYCLAASAAVFTLHAYGY